MTFPSFLITNLFHLISEVNCSAVRELKRYGELLRPGPMTYRDQYDSQQWDSQEEKLNERLGTNDKDLSTRIELQYTGVTNIFP